jgi:hypothetical protein
MPPSTSAGHWSGDQSSKPLLYSPECLEGQVLGSSAESGRIVGMEADLLHDGRTKLMLSRREKCVIELSLLNALYRNPRPGEEAVRRLRTLLGVSVEEAMSLDDELSIIGRELFGFPPNMSEKDREMYLKVMPEEPRKTGTVWDELPRIEAELLPDGWLSFVLGRDELNIFAGAIDAMLVNLARHRSEADHAEVRLCVGAEIEETEAVRDELRRLDWEMRIERRASGLTDVE